MSGAQLDREALDVIDQRLLNLALATGIGGAEEIEEVGVLEDLSSHTGLFGRQRCLEIRESLTLAFVGTPLDL
jgi:hypothetical protein